MVKTEKKAVGGCGGSGGREQRAGERKLSVVLSAPPRGALPLGTTRTGSWIMAGFFQL